MESLRSLVETLNFYIWSFGIPIGDESVPLVVLALIGVGLFLTLRLGFVQFRRLGHGAAVATGRYDDPDDPGDVSHFQALSTALSATVGIGNIGGVAIAIHWGGPGALFWMWLTALLGMATKFAEVTLAQKYRAVETEEGGNTVAGGPMYYIERGLGSAWRPMALFFAIMLGLTAFLTGNGVQANTVADTVEAIFAVDPAITGAVSAALVAAVILGGIRRIGRVTSILAPAMALLYVAAALVILVMNAGQILPTLGLIVREAFEPSAGVAGTGVGAVLVTMMWGVKRGLFSNEAGQGSAPIAHAAAKTDEPVSEGVVALLEPFIDTIVICTMTALVIVITGVWSERVPTELTLEGGDLVYVTAEADGGWEAVEEPQPVTIEDGRPEHAGDNRLAWHDVPVERLYVDEGRTEAFSGVLDPGGGRATSRDGEVLTRLWGDAVESGAPLTMLGFQRGLSPLGDFGHYVVLVCVLLFGISTAISWSYYGDRCAHYVLGAGAVLPYRVIFVGMHFMGAVLPLKLAWDLGDVMLGIVILPNLVALVLLSPQVVEMTRSYFRRRPWRQG
ncbi:MAG: sodium:alanine symporter family protein [Myxococcales bacterium]|nr:sodium:alanine symporter family protein [Myxococcales bacterium]